MKRFILTFFLLINMAAGFCQTAPAPYGALPSKAQLNWHEMAMYCIIHFGVDTYTDKEWGFGDEDPAIFNPSHFDAGQIVGAAKAGGFKGVVIVAKHHDGLCIWPTKTTEHNISHTKWKNGKGDMVKEYQLACEKLGMQMGLYCSPWDRNSPYYGQKEYVEIYRNQIKELYTNYGKIFISWHDGANGGDGFYGGANDARKIDRSTYYGWDTTWNMIRKLQPSAAIFGDIGPDVRWVGNEEGFAGETSWATYTPMAPDEGKKPSNGYSKYWEATEGTRNGKFWMPAECDVSLRPGWFYHQQQNNQLKSPYTLLDLYYKSVGRGANLDLGLSPNKQGQLDTEDVATLKQFGDLLRQTFAENVAKGAVFTASNIRGNNKSKYGPQFLVDNDRYSYWSTDDGVHTPSLLLTMATEKSFNVIRLRENIKLGQRISAFEVQAWTAGHWKKIASSTSIGANRLIRLPQTIHTRKVRLIITASPVAIALSDFGLYNEPEHLSSPVISRDQTGKVFIQTTAPVSALYYTVNGSIPTLKSAIYSEPFLLPDGGIVRAIARVGNNTSEAVARELEVSKSGWSIKAGGAMNQMVAAIDENEATFWSTLKKDSTQKFSPDSLSIDLKKVLAISSFSYLPRQDKLLDGIVDQYAFYGSVDGLQWRELAAGEFSNIRANPINQVIKLKSPVRARYIRFVGRRSVKGNGITVAEIGISIL